MVDVYMHFLRKSIIWGDTTYDLQGYHEPGEMKGERGVKKEPPDHKTRRLVKEGYFNVFFAYQDTDDLMETSCLTWSAPSPVAAGRKPRRPSRKGPPHKG